MTRSSTGKNFTITTLRLETKLMDCVRETARRNRRSLSGEIATLCEEALAQRRQQQSKQAHSRHIAE